MKIFLDDVRSAPDKSWTVCRTAKEALAFLNFGVVTEISFDHDLGPCEFTGYFVASKIEELVYQKVIKMPKWTIHSANPVGRARIKSALQSAERFAKKNNLIV